MSSTTIYKTKITVTLTVTKVGRMIIPQYGLNLLVLLLLS
jgi:hypothetical protein